MKILKKLIAAFLQCIRAFKAGKHHECWDRPIKRAVSHKTKTISWKKEKTSMELRGTAESSDNPHRKWLHSHYTYSFPPLFIWNYTLDQFQKEGFLNSAQSCPHLSLFFYQWFRRVVPPSEKQLGHSRLCRRDQEHQQSKNSHENIGVCVCNEKLKFLFSITSLMDLKS